MSDDRTERAGDFDEFVASEFTGILALAIALLRDRDDGLDVAQETMARSFARWDDVATMDRPGAWARRVALNLVTDTQRRRTRLQRLHARLRVQAPPAADAPESERWDRAFWDVVATLPRRQREAVALHYVEDLPIAEIARILDVPDGTVKSDLSRARAHLRDTIEGSDT